MTLTYGFNSIGDVLAKLEREAKALREEEVNGDRFYNFVITGYSMIDWVRNDPTVPASAKHAGAVDGLYSDRWLKICGDLATASKHFNLTRRIPITSTSTTESGWGIGRFGKGGYGVGEENIEVTLNDGTVLNALEIVQGVQATWKAFFHTHHI